MEIKYYGAFVLNRRVYLHAIDATPARWRDAAGSSPLDRARAAAPSLRNDLVKKFRVHPTHWLISTQVLNASGRRAFARAYTDSLEGRGGGFVRAVAPEHVSAALNLVIAALIFAPRFDIDVPAPPKFLP